VLSRWRLIEAERLSLVSGEEGVEPPHAFLVIDAIHTVGSFEAGLELLRRSGAL
jgi:hypothetical protein